MLAEIFQSAAFQNGFWVFVGIISGALIQYYLGYLQSRRQAKNALKVMQIEVAYNLSEVESFKKHLGWLKQRISAGQIEDNDFFFPMQKFDYSSIGPLANSGYFHILLGPEKVRSYLEFNHFFRIENGRFLESQLKADHVAGRSLAFLESVEKRTEEISGGLRAIGDSRLKFGKMKLTNSE